MGDNGCGRTVYDRVKVSFDAIADCARPSGELQYSLVLAEGYMDRRQSTRIPFKAAAQVVQNGKALDGEIRDICNHGIFISTQSHYEKGDKTLVSVHLQAGETTLSVTLPCAVTRVSDTGIGCSSPHLEPETLLFISNLIHAQKLAPTEFMRSFYSYMVGLELSPAN
jgi:hypothetical protein